MRGQTEEIIETPRRLSPHLLPLAMSRWMHSGRHAGRHHQATHARYWLHAMATRAFGTSIAIDFRVQIGILYAASAAAAAPVAAATSRVTSSSCILIAFLPPTRAHMHRDLSRQTRVLAPLPVAGSCISRTSGRLTTTSTDRKYRHVHTHALHTHALHTPRSPIAT